MLFAPFTHRQWESIADLAGPVLGLILFWYGLSVETFHQFVLAHIDEDFANTGCFGLNDEAFKGLNYTATLIVYDWFTVCVEAATNHTRQLFWDFASLKHLAEFENLFVGKLLHSWWLGRHCRHASEPITSVHITLTTLERLAAIDSDTLSRLSKLILEHLHI